MEGEKIWENEKYFYNKTPSSFMYLHGQVCFIIYLFLFYIM